MRKRALLCLTLALLLTACGHTPEQTGTPVTIYTAAPPEERVVLEERVVFCPEGEVLWAFALRKALDGAGGRASFPDGVTARAASLEDGIVYVTLSEEAAALTGLSLTLARAGIVLTLTALDGIDGVTFASANQEPVTLRAADFVLGSLVLGNTERTITLYFSDETGERIVTETRTLVVRETDTVGLYLQYMLAELITGPRTQGLRPVIPEGTRLLSVLVGEDGDCTVNLSGEFAASGDDLTARMALSCLLRSVTAQPDVTSLSLLIDGQARVEYFGIDISQPLTVQNSPWIIR